MLTLNSVLNNAPQVILRLKSNCIKTPREILHQIVDFNRICMLGDRLLASNAYDDCSKNDTKLKELFQRTTFWNTTCTSDIDGAPGLSSGVFDG